MSGRVRIGQCSNPADAALVHSVFAAHDLEVVIGAEHHASLLGPLGSAFLSLDIWVAEDDAQEAQALLRDLRESDHSASSDSEAVPHAGVAGDLGHASGGFDARDATADGDAAPHLALEPGLDDDDDDDDDDDGEAAANPVQSRIDRRRRTGLVLLFGCCLTFGTGHFVAGAWLPGLALAAIEGAGIRFLATGHPAGTLAVLGAILADVIGGVWRVRRSSAVPLPRARARRI